MELTDLRALETILKTLAPLTDDEKARVLRWAVEKLGITDFGLSQASAGRKLGVKSDSVELAFTKHPGGFQNIGEFVAAAHPKTDADRVLCAALYLQDLSGDSPERTLTGKEVNDALKHLGYGVKNITDAINTLKARSPQHMIQMRKSGSARQSWKEYRVTKAGHDYVFRLIAEGNGDAEA